jgi:hypothetical protein
VVIDVELGREDHSLIPATAIEGVETTWCENWPLNQIKLVVKGKKNTCLTNKWFKYL